VTSGFKSVSGNRSPAFISVDNEGHSMSTPELIASYWTLAGDSSPFDGKQTSPHSFPSRVQAAARVGFKGIGSTYSDLIHNIGKYGYSGIKAILDDNGMKFFEIEALLDWFTDGERRRQSDAVRVQMLRAAEALGAYQIKIAGDINGDWPVAAMAKPYRQLCAEAAAAGTRISLEVLPFTNVKDLSTGLAVVGDRAIDNGGLLLDIWHMNRGGISYEEVAKVPQQFVAAIELNDGPLDVVEPLLEESIDRRKLCGEGGFDVKAFLAAVERTGYRGPMGVEILSHENRARPLDEAARVIFESTTLQFA
jgi:sugar phosphate isomerase/epimerase